MADLVATPYPRHRCRPRDPPRPTSPASTDDLRTELGGRRAAIAAATLAHQTEELELGDQATCSAEAQDLELGD